VIRAALEISLVVATAATGMAVACGTFAGWALARRPFPGRELLDALFSLPLVLPPTVTCYYLLVVLGRNGVLGAPIRLAFGLTIPFTLLACVIAATVMALPFVVRAARVAFEEIDPRQRVAAASLGATTARTFWRVEIPLARRGLAAGAALAFARALGEFGATLMLAGNIPGRTQTLPLALYEATLTGEDTAALLLSAALTAVSIVVLLWVGRLGRGRA
jgi:molybdate transport system permease protein